MSFSKAKVIRFNEVAGKTNPNLVKNKENEKTKKPLGSIANQSPTVSENGSVKSVPTNFKTPTLPKRTKTISSCTKLKPKDLFTNDFEALKEKTAECESKTKYIHKLTEELERYKRDLEDLVAEKERIQREHQNELQNLELQMLQTVTKLQKQEELSAVRIQEIQQELDREIAKLKRAHEYHIGQVILDYEIKIKDLNESSMEELRTKLAELEDSWKEKLQNKETESDAILKECQAISEYSIIECELEKKEIQKSLDDLRVVYDELKENYDKVKTGQKNINDNLEAELELKIEKLSNDLQEKQEELDKLRGEIKTYQITISSSQTTIEVLKRRLFDSDRDVEQLKEELSICEERLLEYENRHFHLTNELKEAREENLDLDLQYESAVKLNEESIKVLRTELLNKISSYEEQVSNYGKKITEDQALKEQIMKQLNDNIETIKHINLEVEKTEEYYALKVKDLEETVEICKAKEESLENKLLSLTETNEITKSALIKKEELIEELENKVQNLEHKYSEANDLFDYYKTKSEELEAEAKDSSQIRKKYIDISGKYDVLLQDFEHLESENAENKAQISGLTEKLQSLLKIQEDYEKIKAEKDILESENASYKNKIDEQKLKKYKFAANDKENIGSPNRSIMESPNRGSPFRGSPFRERN